MFQLYEIRVKKRMTISQYNALLRFHLVSVLSSRGRQHVKYPWWSLKKQNWQWRKHKSAFPEKRQSQVGQWCTCCTLYLPFHWLLLIEMPKVYGLFLYFTPPYCTAFLYLEHTRTLGAANSLLNICFGKRMKDLVSLSLSLSLYLSLSCWLFSSQSTIQYLSLSCIYWNSFREP